MGMSNAVSGIGKLSEDFMTPYCMVCPGRTVLPIFTGDIKQLVVDFSSKTKLTLTALGMAVTGAFVVGAFAKKRFFCLFCPMSALQYIFSKIGLLRLIKDGSKCTKCGNCYRVCDVGIKEIADDVVNRNIVQDDCMMCFKCVAACPEEKCLDVRFLGMPVYRSTEKGFFKRMEGKGKDGN
jgi:polyferredoxin